MTRADHLTNVGFLFLGMFATLLLRILYEAWTDYRLDLRFRAAERERERQGADK